MGNGNALVKIEQSALELYGQYEGMGFDGFGEQEFVKPPVIGVAQPTSDHKPDGVFYRNDTGEDLGNSICIIPLHIQRTMIFRPDGGYDSPAICWSRDMWTPAPDVPERQAKQCHKRTARRPVPVCPMASWTGKTGERTPPPCKETWVMAVALVGEDMVFVRDACALMYLRSTNLPDARLFMGQFRTIYKRLPLFGAAVDLLLSFKAKKDGYLGNFYTINWPDLKVEADRLHILPPEQLAELADTQKFFKDYLESSGEVAEEPAAPIKELSFLEDDDVPPHDDNDAPSFAVSVPATSGSVSPSGTGWGRK
jgi:hypothetical protein